MVDVDKILSIARLRPVQPSDVAKAVNIDSIVAGAILSDLVSKKILKVSNLKLGSSPLYFVKGNEFHLLNFLSFLNEKDRKTVDLLKENKVLRFSQQNPLVRVSLANIKDFAIPLEVFHNNQKEMFYKWFLLKDDEAKKIIEKIISNFSSESKQQNKNVFVEKKEADKIIKEDVLESKKVNKTVTQSFEVFKKNLVSEKPKELFVDKTSKDVDVFFVKNNIKILNVLSAKKKTSKEYVVTLPTPVGDVKFYCVVLTKNRISDADISKVIVKSQLRKLPALLIYSGILTVKAEELSKSVSEILIKRIE